MDRLLPSEGEDDPEAEAAITFTYNILILSHIIVTQIRLVGVAVPNLDPSLSHRAVHPSSRREVDRIITEVSRTTRIHF